MSDPWHCIVVSDPVTLALIAVALVYLRGWYQLRNALPNVLSVWRLAAFMSGVVFAVGRCGVSSGGSGPSTPHGPYGAASSPDDRSGSVDSAGSAGDRAVARPAAALHSARSGAASAKPAGARGSDAFVTHPVFCWLASTAVVIGWHVPALFELGMRSAGWHEVEHACFLAAGLLFWWPVVQPWPSLARWPRWRIPLYLFLATLPCDALSAFLTFCNRVVYPHYLSAHRLFDISPLGRPGVRRRADVGLGDVCLSGPGGRGHNPDAFAAETWHACGGRLNAVQS